MGGGCNPRTTLCLPLLGIYLSICNQYNNNYDNNNYYTLHNLSVITCMLIVKCAAASEVSAPNIIVYTSEQKIP